MADLYRAMGATATRNMVVAGTQVDVLVRQPVASLDEVVIAVEVKDHPGRSMPITEVREFYGRVRPLLDGGHCRVAHLVTTGRVTPDSRNLVNDTMPHAEVYTVSELERRLLLPSAGMRHWLSDYRSRPINATYVELGARPSSWGGEETAVGPSVPATSLLDVAIANPNHAVLVLGDYGAGKTTALDRIRAVAIERRLDTDTGPVPIGIELKKLGPDLDVEQLALAALRNDLGVMPPPDAFWRLVKAGTFLFMLDGFDEITLKADENQRGAFLSRLSPLIFSASPAIMTSRPSYFASPSEYRRLLERLRSGDRPLTTRDRDPAGRRVDSLVADLTARYVDDRFTPVGDVTVHPYHLESLTSEQIDEFLDQHADAFDGRGTTPSQVRQFLDSIYDLSDLITRPILLDMAVVSVLNGMIDPTQGMLANGPAGLYEAYSRVRLDRDWRGVPSRQEFLDIDARLAFAEACAVKMADTDELRLAPADVAAIARSMTRAAEHDSIHEVMTDLRTCSFLTIDESGALEFIHRSYQEYFFALHLRNELGRRDLTRLSTPLRWEYLYFLGAFGFTDNDFYNRLHEAAGRRATRTDATVGGTSTRRNAATALFAARERAVGVELLGEEAVLIRRHIAELSGGVHRDGLIDAVVDELRLTECGGELRVLGEIAQKLDITDCDLELDLAGAVAQVSQMGGSVEVNAAIATCKTYSVDNGRLHVLADLDLVHGHPLTVRARSSAVTIDALGKPSEPIGCSVEATRCHLRLDQGGAWGTVNECVVEVPAHNFGSFGAEVRDSIVLLRPSQVDPPTAVRPPMAGSGNVAVISPRQPFTSWWSAQADLVTIGGRSSEGTWTGLTFQSTANGTQRPRNELDVRRVEEGCIVVAGQGRSWDQAVDRLEDIIRRLTSEQLRTSTWLVDQVSNFLSSMDVAASWTREVTDRMRAPLEATQRALTDVQDLRPPPGR